MLAGVLRGSRKEETTHQPSMPASGPQNLSGMLGVDCFFRIQVIRPLYEASLELKAEMETCWELRDAPEKWDLYRSPFGVSGLLKTPW